jgi:hypothetical protein
MSNFLLSLCFRCFTFSAHVYIDTDVTFDALHQSPWKHHTMYFDI